nr:hypothetical protein [Tanacetum cinerariifolium]
MVLTFADTHNMIAFLTKSDASEGFEQILDFLNASVIKYALTVNPTIYVSCIKQFWSSVSIKKTNDVVRLQALIDRRKVIITEDTVRQALLLDDAESINCLPNEEIFAELERMGRMHPNRGKIPELDADKDVTLEEVAADLAKDADAQRRLEESQAQVYHINLEHADKVLITAAATTITVAPITAAPSAARRRNGVVIRDPEKIATPSTIVHSNPRSKDKGKGILLEEEAIKALKRKSESSEQQAVKKQKLDEEVEELKTHLQIVPNDEDNVYTEATPLALKVHVVDYQIHTKNNKPHYKIIRADGTHQLFLSFISLLRNFDREDLEMLWQIVQERFASSELKNFSDDFLLTTLKAMFEKPDVEAHIWKNQRGNYGLAKVKS